MAGKQYLSGDDDVTQPDFDVDECDDDPLARGRKRGWSPADDKRLTKLRDGNASWSAIAATLRMSVGRCRYRLEQLRLGKV